MSERYDIPPDTKAERCKGRSCGLPIYFVAPDPAKPRRKIPVNADGTPHWRNCVNAKDFRKVHKHAGGNRQPDGRHSHD